MPAGCLTLQAIMGLIGSVAALGTKVDRLITDVAKQGDKLDSVQHQISFVRGAMWVIGAFLALVIAAATAFLRMKGG